MITLAEFWKEYHTVITFISGGVLSFILYKLPKPGLVLKVVILATVLFFLTGLLGLIKFTILVAAFVGYMYGGGFALWIYGVIAIVFIKRAYGWELEWWQIFLITGIWFPISMFIDIGIKAALVTRLKRIVHGGSAYLESMIAVKNIIRNLVTRMLSFVAAVGSHVKAEGDNYFHSDNYSFSTVFPEGWKVSKTKFGGVQAVFKVGNRRESYITIHREEATLDDLRVIQNNELGDYRLLFWKEQGLSAKILGQGNGAIGREQGHWVESHLSGSFPQIEKSYVVVKDGYLYTISTMVTPDDPSWYAKNRVLFENAVSSFEIE